MKQPGESPGWLFSISARFVLASNLNVAWGPIETGGGKPARRSEILSISLKRKKKKFLRFFYNFCDCVFGNQQKRPVPGWRSLFKRDFLAVSGILDTNELPASAPVGSRDLPDVIIRFAECHSR